MPRSRRRHRQPAGRATAAQRPAIPSAGAARPTASSIPPGGTRGAALGAGRHRCQPSRAAQRPQHLSARRREGHRRVLQQPRRSARRVDAIQEFKIQKTMYPAEFGGKASALINVVTKSGSNRVARQRAGVRAQRRSSTRATTSTIRQADAAAPAAPVRRQPRRAARIATGRSFFFSYEGQRIQRSLTQTFSVPTDALRTGDFGGPPPLCDPLTRTAAGCTPFAGNQIPAERLDPVARGAARQGAAPDERRHSCRTFWRSRTQINPMNQFSVASIIGLPSDDTLFGRFTAYACATIPAVRHQLAERSARARLWPHRDDQAAQPRARLHPRVRRALLNEFRFGYLSARRRTGEPQCRA